MAKIKEKLSAVLDAVVVAVEIFIVFRKKGK